MSLESFPLVSGFSSRRLCRGFVASVARPEGLGRITILWVDCYDVLICSWSSLWAFPLTAGALVKSLLPSSRLPLLFLKHRCLHGVPIQVNETVMLSDLSFLSALHFLECTVSFLGINFSSLHVGSFQGVHRREKECMCTCTHVYMHAPSRGVWEREKYWVPGIICA